jgi:MFS family permease
MGGWVDLGKKIIMKKLLLILIVLISVFSCRPIAKFNTLIKGSGSPTIVFESVFGLTSSQFSILGSFTALLVFIFSLMVPSLRKRYGYRMTIVIVQAISICCLVTMAMMELYVGYSFAMGVAIAAYVLRQPLMHMAHPASNELMMNYVGEKNQE